MLKVHVLINWNDFEDELRLCLDIGSAVTKIQSLGHCQHKKLIKPKFLLPTLLNQNKFNKTSDVQLKTNETMNKTKQNKNHFS